MNEIDHERQSCDKQESEGFVHANGIVFEQDGKYDTKYQIHNFVDGIFHMIRFQGGNIEIGTLFVIKPSCVRDVFQGHDTEDANRQNVEDTGRII
tara:strand:+ start:193 stop:477 length:285 start_codon:yes stop_codon:yes gene_type:complete